MNSSDYRAPAVQNGRLHPSKSFTILPARTVITHSSFLLVNSFFCAESISAKTPDFRSNHNVSPRAFTERPQLGKAFDLARWIDGRPLNRVLQRHPKSHDLADAVRHTHLRHHDATWMQVRADAVRRESLRHGLAGHRPQKAAPSPSPLPD